MSEDWVIERQKFGCKWATTLTILGIYLDINRMGEITELNVFRKTGEIQKSISTWKSRNLTPHGKFTIIKSLIYNNPFASLSNVLCIKAIKNTFLDFLWWGKHPKWRKYILASEIYQGGLKLHNISLFDKTLKLSWLRRFLTSNSKWTVIPQDFK